MTKWFVCFHAGAALGTYGTLRSAILAAEGAAIGDKKRTNVYPVDDDGRKGLRVAKITPERLPSGQWIYGLAQGEAALT